MNVLQGRKLNSAPSLRGALRHDLIAGVTVALVAVPQCMGFAAIAGLPPATGLYAAIVMGLMNGALTGSSLSIVGPAITTSTMVYGVLASAAPRDHSQWPAIAALLAIIVGGFTVLGAALRVGDLVRYISRAVLTGLTVGVGVLIFGGQLGPFLGIPVDREPRLLTMLIHTFGRLGEISWPDVLMGLGTLLAVVLGGRYGRRFPSAFAAIVAGGVLVWALRAAGADVHLAIIEPVPRDLPSPGAARYRGPFVTEFLVGAAAITVVGMIQTLALQKAFAAKAGERIHPRHELFALGVSNVASGLCGGFPGAESMSRTAINHTAGARTRLSGIICALVMALIVFAAAPLAAYVTKSAIAGLMMATAWSVVDWSEVRELLTRARYDRFVLLVTLGCLLVLPIHWAVLIGISVSIALFLQRVSKLSIFEMVDGGGGYFIERPIDDNTGRSAVTMLQLEGPLFFAHADEIAEVLQGVFERKPAVTIIRMRRTQQIDFSVLTAMSEVIQEYQAAGGRVIICGLAPGMHRTLRDSRLGELLPADAMLRTTREVFGSAHKATQLARQIVGDPRPGDRPMFRRDEEPAENAAQIRDREGAAAGRDMGT